jgi:hypothetical protein
LEGCVLVVGWFVFCWAAGLAGYALCHVGHFLGDC